MFSDLEEERTRFRKNKEDMIMTKKEQKKEKKLIAAKSGLVGIKGILDILPYQIFLQYINRF